MKTGLEALDSTPSTAKPKQERAPRKAGRLVLQDMRIKPLHDGTYLIAHTYADANGRTNPQGEPGKYAPEYSAASLDDLLEHVGEHLGLSADADKDNGRQGSQTTEGTPAGGQ